MFRYLSSFFFLFVYVRFSLYLLLLFFLCCIMRTYNNSQLITGMYVFVLYMCYDVSSIIVLILCVRIIIIIL